MREKKAVVLELSKVGTTPTQPSLDPLHHFITPPPYTPPSPYTRLWPHPQMQYSSPAQSDQYSAAVQQLQGQVRAAQRERDEALVGQERLREAVKKMEER